MADPGPLIEPHIPALRRYARKVTSDGRRFEKDEELSKRHPTWRLGKVGPRDESKLAEQWEASEVEEPKRHDMDDDLY